MTITTHFTAREFMSHDGVQYPPAWIVTRLTPLCLTLETIRAALERPIVIVSGYRSPAHNAAVGGASASQHMEGRAADIVAVNLSPALVHAEILELFHAGKLPSLGGLGLYPGWVHLDIRERVPDSHLARWIGGDVGGVG